MIPVVGVLDESVVEMGDVRLEKCIPILEVLRSKERSSRVVDELGE
jgi:hypothetical protein